MPPQDDNPAPLTPDEIREIRTILDQDKYVRRVWTTVRTWAVAIAAVIAGISVGFDAIAKAIKFLTGK